MRRHAAQNVVPDQRYITNWLGVKIHTKFFPGILDNKEGHIEPLPIPANWHADIAEWGFALRSVDKADETYRIVEIGCGWGCWLNNTGIAARRKSLKLDLIGIEADAGHVKFAHESLQANSFKDSEYRIVHGVAASDQSKAIFPLPDTPGADYGLGPVFNPSKEQLEAAEKDKNLQILDTFPLSKLSKGKLIDLVHIDIQGSETEYILDNFDDLRNYVRRILVGTHSRQIEGDLTRFFVEKGWSLEMERTAIINIVDGKPVVVVDGVQGWRNPELDQV